MKRELVYNPSFTVTGRPTGAATEASRCPPPETTTASPANNGSGPIGGEGGANGCQILEDVSFSDDSGNDVDAIGTLSPSPTGRYYLIAHFNSQLFTV